MIWDGTKKQKRIRRQEMATVKQMSADKHSNHQEEASSYHSLSNFKRTLDGADICRINT